MSDNNQTQENHPSHSTFKDRFHKSSRKNLDETFINMALPTTHSSSSKSLKMSQTDFSQESQCSISSQSLSNSTTYPKNQNQRRNRVLIFRMTPENKVVMLNNFDEVLDWLKEVTTQDSNRKFMIQASKNVCGSNVYDVMMLPSEESTHSSMVNRLTHLYNIVDKVSYEVASRISNAIDELDRMLSTEEAKLDKKLEKAAVTIQSAWRGFVQRKAFQQILEQKYEQQNIQNLQKQQHNKLEKLENKSLNHDDCESNGCDKNQQKNQQNKNQHKKHTYEHHLKTLIEMGFHNIDESELLKTLEKCKGNLETTVDLLLKKA